MRILFLSVLLLVIGTLHANENGGRAVVAPLHRYITERTQVQCDTTEDCMEHFGYGWCQRGIYCHSDNHCHLIPNFPCQRGEVCNAEKRVCEKRPCQDWRDCNTDSFCQGIERCVQSVCQLDPRHTRECTHGQCSEEQRACITPLSLRNESSRVGQLAQHMVSRAASGGPGFHSVDNITNTTGPTAAPTEAVSTTTVWIFIGILGFILVLVLVVAIISAAYKPVNSVVVFDRTKPTDNGQYITQAFYQSH